MATNKNKLLKLLVSKRSIIQIIIGIGIYFIVGYFDISLWWIVGFGSAIGLIWGKVFCRWMCPLGIFMEFILKINPSETLRQTYQYHKIGCPIAWISGWLNKYSLYKIRINKTSCTSCGICDKSCYISILETKTYSLYKPNMKLPGDSYTCSKCLKCVAACPNGSLQYKINTKE